MEGRAAVSPPGHNKPLVSSRRIRLITVSTVSIAVLAFLFFFAQRDNKANPEDYSQAPTVPSSAPTEGTTPTFNGPAAIVDSDDASSPMATPTPEAQPDVASPAPSPNHRESPVNASKQSTLATTGKTTSQRRRAKATSKQGQDEDLLDTLLGIINEDERKNTEKHESMDSLIAKIQANDKRDAADVDAAFDSIDGARKKAPVASSIQVQLRRCPSANTLEGIECRRRICSKHQGKDPACPGR